MTEPNAKVEPAFCPNCGKPATKRGKVIDCENCDASFRFTQEGARVEQIGAIEELQKRVSALEAGNKPVEPEPIEPQSKESEQEDL